MKLSNEQCKDLYEICRHNNDPEWAKLYPQQKSRLRANYRHFPTTFKERPELYKLSKNELLGQVIETILDE